MKGIYGHAKYSYKPEKTISFAAIAHRKQVYLRTHTKPEQLELLSLINPAHQNHF